jgi:hypothetical protein
VSSVAQAAPFTVWPSSRKVGTVALVVAVVATAVMLPFESVSWAGWQLPMLALALASFSVVLSMHRRKPFLTRRVVLGCSAALLMIAVIAPPQASHDVWSYAMYGRIVVDHHANPYMHAPNEYRTDPALARVDPRWRATRSVYGPVFTVLSATGMAVVGDSATGGRLYFQLLAAGAVAAALLLLARRGADAAALAWIGLNPVVLAVVAGGHNDVLVGLAALAGVLAASDDRPAIAGLALGLGCLIKISGVLPLVAVLAWLAVKHGRRAATRAAVAASTLVVAGYAIVGGRAALQPLRTAASLRSKGSFWVFPVGWAGRHILGWSATGAGSVTGVAAMVAIVVVAAILIAGRLHDADPALAAGGAALVYLLGGVYILPWYAGWTVMVTALGWRSRIAWLAQLQAAGLMLAYIDRAGVDPDSLHRLLNTVGTRVLPGAQAVALVVLAVTSARHLKALRRIPRTVGTAVAG